jgi:hypothetical protein
VGAGTGIDRVTAAFNQDCQGYLSQAGFESGTVRVSRDFFGTLNDQTPGNLNLVTIGRSLTNSGVLLAADNIGILSVGTVVKNQPGAGNVAGSVLIGGNLDTAMINGALSGGVLVGGQFCQAQGRWEFGRTICRRRRHQAGSRR